MNKLKFGMIGGAEGSFVADVHRRAAEFESLRFVEACIASTKAGGAWTRIDG